MRIATNNVLLLLLCMSRINRILKNKFRHSTKKKKEKRDSGTGRRKASVKERERERKSVNKTKEESGKKKSTLTQNRKKIDQRGKGDKKKMKKII